jgi:hypothetical protein
MLLAMVANVLLLLLLLLMLLSTCGSARCRPHGPSFQRTNTACSQMGTINTRMAGWWAASSLQRTPRN